MTGSNTGVLYFTAYIKVNSEQAVDLHVKNKTIKVPENDTEYPHDLEIGKKKKKNFNRTQMTLIAKEKTDKFEGININISYSSKGTIMRAKRQTTEWQRYL